MAKKTLNNDTTRETTGNQIESVNNSSKSFVDALKKDVVNKINGASKEKSPDKKNSQIAFYEPIYGKDKAVFDIKLKYKEFIDLLRSFGYRLLNSEEPFAFVKITDNVIEEVSITEIQKHFINHIKNEHEPQQGVSKAQILEKFYKQPSHYFNPKRLSLLYPDKPITFKEDTDKECFLYFNNGFVRNTSKGSELLGYENLKGAIWFKQKNARDFINLEWAQTDSVNYSDMGVFAQFMLRVSGNKEERFLSLCSIVGYLLHSYFDYKMKAPILTDSKISDKSNGRTGKSLLCKALGKIRNYTEIDGKNFDPANKHKYKLAELGTQILCLNDLKNNFNPEDVFNDITEGIQVEKKNQHPFVVRVKTILTANKTLNTDGDSAKDRFIEFEFSEHYSKDFSPKDDFKHWFFTEWNSDEWNKFDNLMAFCSCYFLAKGLIEPNPINLLKRKLVDRTSLDFVDFMDEQIASKEIVFDKEFIIEDLFNRFFKEYKEYEGNKIYTLTRSRKRWLQFYCDFLGGTFSDRRANSIQYAVFSRKE